MNIVESIKGKLLGRKVGNSDTRHRPDWLPYDIDYRWLGERFAVMDIAPYKPPYRRHARYKAWVCMGPHYLLSISIMAEIDLDKRTLDIEVYR